MVYNSNRQYNTRNSGGGRYNSGQFVAAGPQQQQQQQQQPQQQQQQQFAPPPPPPPQPAPYPARTVQSVNIQPANSQPQQFPSKQSKLQEGDIDMKEEPDAEAAASEDGGSARPSWMKIKKISKKEKRRRQNAHLRRLITPKNALMVLNEMMVHEQLANNFKVEAAETPNQYYKTQKNSFCADLTLDGVSYKGYGGNKLIARNAAAEQAIRDLIIKRMQKAVSHELASANNANNAQPARDDTVLAESQSIEGEEEDPLPMIQLASFALHKLFSEWEYEGHKVPQLKPPSSSMSEGDTESMSGAAGGEGPPLPPSAPRVRSAKKPKEIPAGASGMHPCMLLTYMRPHLEYRELAVDGDRPQRMVFTMGVDVDGATYIGKASNKKEARKNAARAACSALFGVQFDEPPPTPAATPMATA